MVIKKFKVLDLFCGMGGWSKPWLEAGYDVTGVDQIDLDYPGKFIKADIFDWEPDQHYDVVLASPPCSEFSIIKRNTGRYHYSERIGLDLIWRTFDLIKKIKPKFWVIENVKGLTEFLPDHKQVIRYGRHPGKKAAYLWGNLPELGLFSEQIIGPEVRSVSGHNPKIAAARGVIPKALSQAVYDICVAT